MAEVHLIALFGVSKLVRIALQRLYGPLESPPPTSFCWHFLTSTITLNLADVRAFEYFEADVWVDSTRKTITLRPTRWLSDYGIVQSTSISDEKVGDLETQFDRSFASGGNKIGSTYNIRRPQRFKSKNP